MKSVGKIKLSFSKPTFDIDDVNATTKCTLKCRITIPREIELAFGPTLLRDHRMYDPFKTIGETECNPHDKWDTATGMHVAESKAKKEAYQEAGRRIRALLRDFAPVLRASCDFAGSMNVLADYEIDHLGELSR